MTDLDRAQDLILGLLTRRGIVSSEDLRQATGKSQATVSRLLAGLSGRVAALGRARATRYALLKPIRGLPARQPLWWSARDGSVHPLGWLTFVAGDRVHVESGFAQAPPSTALPWFLAPLRAQGFLGRLHARRLQSMGLGGDPEQWDLESTLFGALQLHDPPGAVTLGEDVGEPAARPRHERLPAAGKSLASALDDLALDVARTLPAGSSAGGEQPKFLALLASGQHVLVKFTPPRGTPFGERWHDLLQAEGLASQVLAQHGVAVAHTRVVETARRTYLVSERFDRIGAHGRRHVVAIGDVHKAFVADPYRHWAASAGALARQGRLSPLDAARAAALLAFGRLIGNSDMHAGNLGLVVELEDLAKGRFGLAPVYDMLPMRWRPNATLGAAEAYAPFELDAASAAGPAAGPALDFWRRLAGHDGVSAALRAVAAEMAGRIAGVGDAAQRHKGRAGN